MEFKIIWQVVATCQATFVLGFLILIFIYNAMYIRIKNLFPWDRVCLILSYIALNAATLVTLYNDFYIQLNIWHILIFLGYTLADIAVVFAWRRTLKLKKDFKRNLHELEE